MMTWLRRLWAELKRDELRDYQRAKELLERRLASPWRITSEATKVVKLPAEERTRKAALVRRFGARLRELRAPENSPEAEKREEPKSL